MATNEDPSGAQKWVPSHGGDLAEFDAPVGAQAFIPADARTLGDLKAAATGCKGCELYEDATQVVFGRGDEHAKVVLVGEQPGDVEDQKGLPFVGPAGRLLRNAVDDAGIEVGSIYLSNTVKHFRHSVRGRRRIHETPGPAHITACRPWLIAEFSLLEPQLIVALGATAAKALFGPAFRVTRSRGQLFPWPASAEHPDDFPVAEIQAMATIHPSAVLRADNRDVAYAGLVDDLKIAATALA